MRCTTPGCERAGIVTDVPDVPVVRGVVSRPELYCADCGQVVTDHDRNEPIETAVTGPPENTAHHTTSPRRR